MARCPVCGEGIERPNSSVIQSEALLPPEVADASREMYVQLECPSCEAVMGYLGVAAAAASDAADFEEEADDDTGADGAVDAGRSGGGDAGSRGGGSKGAGSVGSGSGDEESLWDSEDGD